jgi:hypothetical protein
MDALSLTLQVGPSPYHRPFLTAVEKNNLDLPFSKVCVTFQAATGTMICNLVPEMATAGRIHSGTDMKSSV